MAHSAHDPYPPDGFPPPAGTGGGRMPAPAGRRLLIAFAVALGGALLGLLAGVIWAAVAPRVVYQVAAGSPREAFVVASEPTAFFAADAWYCIIALAGGAVLGLLGYLFAIRRHGALPMLGLVAGAVAAAYLARWIGQQSGYDAFYHQLATVRPGTLLRAPITLGSRGALAFWPLAAAAVAGAIELAVSMHARRTSTQLR
jgi:hypothetical protein